MAWEHEANQTLTRVPVQSKQARPRRPAFENASDQSRGMNGKEARAAGKRKAGYVGYEQNGTLD